MSFDICSDCGDSPTRGILFLVIVWTLPTVLLALRRQLSQGSPLAKAAAWALGVSSAAAALSSLALLGVVDLSDPVLMSLTLSSLAGVVSLVVGLGVYRSARRRERSAAQ